MFKTRVYVYTIHLTYYRYYVINGSFYRKKTRDRTKMENVFAFHPPLEHTVTYVCTRQLYVRTRHGCLRRETHPPPPITIKKKIKKFVREVLERVKSRT